MSVNMLYIIISKIYQHIMMPTGGTFSRYIIKIDVSCNNNKYFSVHII